MYKAKSNCIKDSVYIDDGYTGTNFRRPSMQSMLKLVKEDRIDCILVKDFSRFARDYIELGSYLEQIFPFMGVRFISVNDNYDSKDYKGNVGDIDINFKGLLYDLYSKDLSEKVRSSLSVKKEKGQYISGNSPFGYEKNPEDRYALVIAEDEATVVREIYRLALEGCSSVEIAKFLNEAKVKTPIEFKIEKGKTKRTPKGGKFLWSSSVVCQILKNEIYIGNLVQRKYKKDFVGGKNHLMPKEEQLVSCNCHEPIIAKDLFNKVQEGREKKRASKYTPTHFLVGKLVCGSCKRNLSFRKGSRPYFTCNYRYSNGMADCVSRADTLFLEQYVLSMLENKIQQNSVLEKIYKEAKGREMEELGEKKESRQKLFIQLQRQKQRNLEAYEKYASGRAEHFESRDSKIKSMEEELAVLDEFIQEKEVLYGRTEEKGGRGSLSGAALKEMVSICIDKIIFYNKEEIEICWKDWERE